MRPSARRIVGSFKMAGLALAVLLAFGLSGRSATGGGSSGESDGSETATGESQGADAGQGTPVPEPDPHTDVGAVAADSAAGAVTEGTQEYRGFVLDNVLHDESAGDVHFAISIPPSYDRTTPCALFVTLPGYQGLLFQGVGANLETEDFAFEAQSCDSGMIVVAPQLSDWGQTSADQTVALVEYLLDAYRIDPGRVYLEGYSGGGALFSHDGSIMGWLFGR